jgi:hypothetical protein
MGVSMATLWVQFTERSEVRIAKTIAQGFVPGETFLPGQNNGFMCDFSESDEKTLDIVIEDETLFAALNALDKKVDVVRWGFFNLSERPHALISTHDVPSWLARAAS